MKITQMDRIRASRRLNMVLLFWEERPHLSLLEVVESLKEYERVSINNNFKGKEVIKNGQT